MCHLDVWGDQRGAAPLPALKRERCNVAKSPPFKTAGLIKNN